MSVSPYDHESWYGDPNKVAKMQGDDFKKVFYNNLKSLLIAFNPLNSSFNLVNYKKYQQLDPEFIKLIAQSKHLEELNLQGCSMKEEEANLLALSLDPSR